MNINSSVLRGLLGLVFVFALIGATTAETRFDSGFGDGVVGPVSPGPDLGGLQTFAPLVAVPEVRDEPSPALPRGADLSFLEDAGAWLLTQQQLNGGFPWSPGTTATQANIQAPIGLGLLYAWRRTGNADFLTAAVEAGDFLFDNPNTFANGSRRFSAADALFFVELSSASGDPKYREEIDAEYWGPLAAGTYGPDADWNAADYAAAVIGNRLNANIVALAAWDLGFVSVAASRSAQPAIRQQIDDAIVGVLELVDNEGDFPLDLFGLTGAVWAGAIAGEDLNPQAGIWASATTTEDLASLLAGYQRPSGGMPGSTGSTTPVSQATAFSVLGWETLDSSTFASNLTSATSFLAVLQQSDGQILNVIGGDPLQAGGVETHAESMAAFALSRLEADLSVAVSTGLVDPVPPLESGWAHFTAELSNDGAGTIENVLLWVEVDGIDDAAKSGVPELRLEYWADGAWVELAWAGSGFHGAIGRDGWFLGRDGSGGVPGFAVGPDFDEAISLRANFPNDLYQAQISVESLDSSFANAASGSVIYVADSVILPVQSNPVDVVYVDDAYEGAQPGDSLSFTLPDASTVTVVFGIDAFDDLQSGINAVAADGQVFVRGEHETSGQILIDRNLEIQGADLVDRAVISPASDLPGANAADAWILVSENVDFRLADLILDGGSQLVRQGLRNHGQTSIEGVSFRNIQEAQYRGNAVLSFGGIVAGGAGGDSHASPGLAASTLTVTDSDFEQIGRVAILVKGTEATATISDNFFQGKGDGDFLDYAVEIGASGAATIANNEIRDNRGVASTDGSVSGGILVSTFFGTSPPSSATISGNTIEDSAIGIALGFGAADSVDVSIAGNTLVNNDIQLRTSFDDSGLIDQALADNAFDQAVVVTDIETTIFSTIAQAVDAADVGATVQLATDITEGLVALNKPLTLDGGGFTLTSTSANFGVSIQSVDVDVRNLTVDSAGSFGIHQSPGSDGLTIENTTVQNGGGSGFALNCSDNATLADISAFNNTGTGVSISNSSNVTIDGLTTSGNAFGGGFSAGVGIFSNSATCSPDGTSDVTITDSFSAAEPIPVYEQTTTGSIANVAVPSGLTHATGIGQISLFYQTSLANAVDVAEAFIAGDPALQPLVFARELGGPFQVEDTMSIQAAINAAEDGATIAVAAGSFTENLDFSNRNGLILLGAQAGVGAGVAGPRDAASVTDESIIIGSLGFGGGTPTVADLVIDGFRLEQASLVNNGARINGTLELRNLVVDFTTTYFLISVGTGSGHELVLLDSTLSGQRGFSIGNAQVTQATISGNVFNQSAASLVSASALDGVLELTGNQFNGPRGLNLLTNNNLISNNVFNVVDVDGQQHGIDLYEVTGNAIEDNVFNTDDAIGILVRAGGRNEAVLDNEIRNNQFLGSNASGVVNSIAGKSVDASCNWWGAADGPSDDGSGSGSAVAGEIDFEPWQTSAEGACDGFASPVTRLSDGAIFPSFSDAINDPDTLDGETLTGSAATYQENIVVNKAVTIAGAGPDTVIEGGGAAGNGITIPNGQAGVTIRELRVQNFGGNCIFGALSNHNTTIHEVEVDSCLASGAGGGILLNGPVDNVSITDSTVTNSTTRGIVIWNGFKTNITISGNTVSGNNCCGIELQDGTASGVTITNNTVTGNGDNGIGVVGLTSGAGPNLIAGNTVTDNGRFGIEVKLPDGSTTLDEIADGAIVVRDNQVSLTSSVGDLRDLAGIAVFRRGWVAGENNVDIPTGVIVRNNTVSGYRQDNAASFSDGFGIVVEGTNIRVFDNTVDDNDVGIQRQSGHLPYTPNTNVDGDQGNLDDDYFGRGNSPVVCALVENNSFAGNSIDERDVVHAGAADPNATVTNTDTNDFYCSIQDAINAADPGQTLLASVGTFAESLTISGKTDLTLLGAQAETSPLDGRTAGDAAETVIDGQGGTQTIQIGAGASGLTIDGFSITSTAGTTQGVVEITPLTGTTVRNNFVYGYPTSLAVSLAAGSTGSVVETNHITGVYAGVYLSTNAGSLAVTGNRIENLAAGGGDQGSAIVFEGNHSNVVISGNELFGNAHGVYLFTGFGDDLTGTTVSNNSIVGNSAGITNTRSTTLDASCNWWGDASGPSGEGSGSGDSVSDAVEFQPWQLTEGGACAGFISPVLRERDDAVFGSFTAAIADAGTIDGDTLIGAAAVYAESFTVNKSLTITGVGPATVIEGGGASTNGISIPGNRSGVTISNLRVQNFNGTCIRGGVGNNNTLIDTVELANCNGPGNGGGIYFDGPVDNITITNSTITNANWRSIVIWNGFKSNITITDNVVTGNGGLCCGIELQDGTASGVTITGNVVTGHGDSGIGLTGLTGGAGPNLIANNTVTDNGRFGIEIKNPNGTAGTNENADGAIVVRNNTVALTEAVSDARDLAGIAVFRRAVLGDNVDIPTGVIVRNNTVTGYSQATDSDGFGIVVEGTQVRVLDNILQDNDVGLQRQSGHQPYPGDGDQGNLADDYFGRGNSPVVCALLDGNLFTNSMVVDQRDVVQPDVEGPEPRVTNLANAAFHCGIQTAIDDQSTLAGHVLSVDAGMFEETVVVDKAISLLGDPSGVDRPVITWADSVAAGAETLIRVQAEDVTIDGFELLVDQTFIGEAIRTEGNAAGLMVRNNRIVASASVPSSIVLFGIRNAIAVNPIGRPGNVGGGFGPVSIENNQIVALPTGVGIGGFFRAGVVMDTAHGALLGNDILAFTHDAIVRFVLAGNIVVDNNDFRGGGLQLAEFNPTGPASVTNNRFVPDAGLVAAVPSLSSLRLQNNGNDIATTVSGNSFTGHRTAVRAENYPALGIADNVFTPVADQAYQHVVVSNRVNASNYIAPLEIDIAIDGNAFFGGGEPGVALAFDNLNCCEDVGTGTTTASFGQLRVGGVSPNNFDDTLGQYIVLDDTSGSVSFGLAETQAQPFYADVNAVGNIWAGVAGADQDAAERAATRARIIDSRVNGDLGDVILEFVGASVEGTTSVQGIGAPVLAVAGVNVAAFDGAVELDSVLSGAGGAYLIEGLPAGDLSVQGSLAGFASTVQNVTVAEEDILTGLDLILESSVIGAFSASVGGTPLAGQSFFAARNVADVDLSVTRSDDGPDLAFYASLTVFDSLGNEVDYINDGLFSMDTLIALSGVLGEGNDFTLTGVGTVDLLSGVTLEVGPNADQLDVATLSFRLIDSRFGSPGSRIVHAASNFAVTIEPEPSVALQGLGSNILSLDFTTDVVASGGLYNGQSPTAIAASITDAADKQAFLDEFFEIRVSIGGVPTLVPAAALDTYGADWSKVIIGGSNDSLSVTFEPGLIDLGFDLDQGNTGASRIDSEWIGTDGFVTAAGQQPLIGPDAADNPYKVEFDVAYDLATGPAYGPATATFIDRTTPLQRPFATGIQFGTVTTDPVAIEFAQSAGVSATVSRNGEAPQAYDSGDVLTAAGDYVVLVTNDSNPNIVSGAQTAVNFTIESELTIAIDGPMMVAAGDTRFYEVTLENALGSDPGENVLGQVVVARAAGIAAADLVVDYCADSATAGTPDNCSNWLALNLAEDGANLVATFGPAGGFPVPGGYEATTFFRVSFIQAGNYDVFVNALGVDSDSVLASDTIEVTVTELSFDVAEGVAAGIPDEESGWAYFTATLVNEGDALPENVALWVAVDGIDDNLKVAENLEIEYFNGTSWENLGWAGQSSFNYGYLERDAWFLGRPEVADGTIEGFPVAAGAVFPTPIRVNFDNGIYELTVTVETADQTADPMWLYGEFVESLAIVSVPEGSLAAEIDAVAADGQTLIAGDAYGLTLSAADVLPRSGKDLFVVFDGQRPSDSSGQPGEQVCVDLLGPADCAAIAAGIGFANPLDVGDLVLFDDQASIRGDAEPGSWTLSFYLVEAIEGIDGPVPGDVVDTLSIELIVEQARVALNGLGSNILALDFTTDVVASGGLYDTLSPAGIAGLVVTAADKQAFLDEFFEIRVSIGGVPTLVPAAALDTYGADWSKVIIGGSNDSLSVTFEPGLIDLGFDLDQGNTGASRIDSQWIGTNVFVTAAGQQPLIGPDAADNPYKVEFDVAYDLATGPAYGPATATFIDRTTLLQRPFVTGIQFGGVARAPVAVEFAAGVSAEVSFDGVTEPYVSGTDLTAVGSYRIVATNDSNPSVVLEAQTALEFTIVEPAGTLAVTADGAPLDGESIVRGNSRLLNIAVDDVEAPLGAELAVVFDGFAPGDGSAQDGSLICAQLLEAADCAALEAVISLGNTFSDDIVLFNDTVTVLETAAIGSWTLRFFLVEVVDGAIAGVFDQLDATIEVLEGADLALSIDGPILLPIGEQGIYEVNLSNLGDAATLENVEVQFTVSRPGIALGDLAVEYCQDSGSAGAPADCNWLPLSFISDNGSLSSRFGPAGGFPVPVGYDATTFIRATFAEAGNYAVLAEVVGIDSASVLAGDTVSIAVPALSFEIEEGVAAGVDDSDIGFGYFTAELANLGDDLPELVRLYIEVRDSDGFIVDDANRFEFWNATSESWDSLAYDILDQRWAFGPATGFPVEAGYFAATAVRADFPNDLYDLVVTVETADRDATPIWIYGLFERQIALVSEPEGELAGQINGAPADGQSLTVGDVFELELTASDVLPRSGKDLFVVFDGQRPSDSGNIAGEVICEALLGAADCTAIAAGIGFANALDVGDSTLFDDAVSIRPDAEIGSWTLNFYLVEALDDGAGGSTPGQVVDTLSVALTIDEATVAIDGLGTDTLTIEFSTDVVASGGLYDGLSPAAIAALAVDADSKQALLDEFFEIRLSIGGVPTPVPAAALNDFGTDWTKILFAGTNDSLSVTFEAGVIDLDFSLDQGNTGATRIDVEWIGTSAFVTESGGQPLAGPDTADNPFKVEFDVAYDLATGPAYGPATATFIDRTTPLQRPFATGIQFGTVTTDPVAIEFAQSAGVSATVSRNGEAPQAYDSGDVLTAAGDYVVLVTNDSNPNIVSGAQTAVNFTIELATVTLSGLETSTLVASFSEEVVSSAAGYVGLTPAQVAATAVDAASKQNFLMTYFDFNAAELGLVSDWTAVIVDGTDTELSVSFGPGLFELSYALDQGNTGASRIDAAWDGTDKFETLSGQPLIGPAESAFKLEFTVPYDALTGVDYSAALTTTFIDVTKPLLRPFAPGIESGTSTSDPVAINYAVGSYATGLAAEYSRNGAAPVSYASGDQLTAAGDYELTVTNVSNPLVAAGASTTIRFTIEAGLVLSIDGPTLAPLAEPVFYAVTLQNEQSTDPGENVEAGFSVSRPGIVASDVLVEYCLDSASAGTAANCADWIVLNLAEVNGSLVGSYGPAGGFAVPAGYEATTFFRVSFNAAGNYDAAASVTGVDSGNVLASDQLVISVSELQFEIEAGVPAGVDDTEAGFAYYTADLINLGDELPELVRLYIEVADSDGLNIDNAFVFEFWNAMTESWDSLAFEIDDQRWAFGPASGFLIDEAYAAATPIRVNFPNDLYDLVVTVETADRNADPIWAYGLFERQIAVISDPVNLAFELARGVTAADQPPRWDYFTATLSNIDGGATPDNIVLFVEVAGTDFSAGDALEFWNGTSWQTFGWDAGRQAWFLGRDGVGGVSGFPIAADEVFPIETRVNFLPDSYAFTVTVESIDDQIVGVGGVYATFNETVEVLPTEATITFNAADLVQTFDGNVKTVGVTTAPEPDLDVAISFDPEPPVNAGSYVVNAVITDPYFVGSAVTSLLIEKGQADVVLGDLSQVYAAGAELPVSVSTDPIDLDVIVSYDGMAAVPTDVGSYSVVATVSDANWTGSAAGILQITPASADVVLDGLAQTFDGSPREVSVETVPAGLNVTLTYDGSAAAPVNAGSYEVIATVVDDNYVGSATATLVVEQAAVIDIQIGNLVQTFDGMPKAVSVSTDPAGLGFQVSYDGDAAAPVNAGSYEVVVTIVDQNYFGSATATLLIEQGQQVIDFPALPDRTVNDSPFTLVASANSGLTVSFELISGPATVTGNEVTLTGALGEVVIEASQAGDDNWMAAENVQQSFQVTEGNADRIEAVSETEISGVAGQPVDAADLPVVLVLDEFDNPVAGVTVAFEIDSGSGSLSGSTQVTDGDGLASLAGWTLGSETTQTVLAVASGLTGSPVTFTATVTPAADLSVIIDDNRATIEVGERNTYVVTVTNAGPNAISDVDVAVSMPDELDADTAEWSCFPAGGAICQGAGTGGISDTVDVPVGGSLVYILQADVLLGPTQTIVKTATLTPPAGVVIVDQTTLVSTVTTQVVVTEDGIFRDRFEPEAPGFGQSQGLGGARAALSGFIELPGLKAGLLPVQRLVSARASFDRVVFEITLVGAKDQTWIRLSARGQDDLWQHGQWQPMASSERWLAFDYLAESGLVLLAGEELEMVLELGQPGRSVHRLITSEKINVSIDD